jgi:hypothetical protein
MLRCIDPRTANSRLEFKMEEILLKIEKFDELIEQNRFKEASKHFMKHYETYLENYGIYSLEGLAKVKKTMSWNY